MIWGVALGSIILALIGWHMMQALKASEARARELVAERARAERDLLAALEAAEAASEAKSIFLTSMSHEFRTPLNAIIGFAQMLDLGVPTPLTAAQQAAVGHILDSGRHLHTLINDILDLARIESGRPDLRLESVAPGPLIETVIALLQPAAAARQIRMRHDCDGHLQIFADPVRVRQILLNLLSNAVKYNRVGGEVTVTCSPQGDRVRVTVADTGPGIPESRRGELFQPFQRLGAENTNIEGTGIGLVLCKRLVEAMGGRIGYETAVGEGSRFWFELALATPATTAVAAMQHEIYTPSPFPATHSRSHPPV